MDREQGGRKDGDEGEHGVIGVLARTHVRGLREEEALVIAARLAGGGLREAGRLLAYSDRQMRRRWDELMEIILVPPGLARHDDASAAVWAVLHRPCCTARVFALLKSDARFTSGFTSAFP